MDLSEPGHSSGGRKCSGSSSRRSPLRRKSPRRRARPDETELIQVEVDRRSASPRTPERTSLESGNTDPTGNEAAAVAHLVESSR